jgi:hypothetical protein
MLPTTLSSRPFTTHQHRQRSWGFGRAVGRVAGFLSPRTGVGLFLRPSPYPRHDSGAGWGDATAWRPLTHDLHQEMRQQPPYLPSDRTEASSRCSGRPRRHRL